MKVTLKILSRVLVVGGKIRDELKKTGWKVVFRFTANLKSILSSGKLKLLSNRYPGMR